MKKDLACKIIVEVINSNPNGDPSSSGRPRERGDGTGHITGVSLKRKVRDFLAANEKPNAKVFLKSGIAVKSAAEDYTIAPEGKGKKKAKEGEEAKVVDNDKFLAEFIDVRLFGQVLAKLGGRIGGAALVSDLFTSHQIDIQDDTITTSFLQNEDQNSNGLGTMGRKSNVRYGLYEGTIHISHRLANKNKLLIDDVAAFLEALVLAYPSSPSAARPNVRVRMLQVFATGNVQDVALGISVKTDSEAPTSFADFCEVDLIGDRFKRAEISTDVDTVNAEEIKAQLLKLDVF